LLIKSSEVIERRCVVPARLQRRADALKVGADVVQIEHLLSPFGLWYQFVSFNRLG
jgi:hypothetical protein